MGSAELKGPSGAGAAGRVSRPPPPLPGEITAFRPGQVLVPGQDGTSGPLFILEKLGAGVTGFVYLVVPIARGARYKGQPHYVEVPTKMGIHPGLDPQAAKEIASSVDRGDQFGVPCVLKVLKHSPGTAQYNHALDRTNAEIRTHKRVTDEGSSSFPMYIADGWSPWRHMVLEYVRGIRFTDYLWKDPSDRRHTDGFLRWQYVFGFWSEFLPAIAHLHKKLGIVHRDLKVENVILRENPITHSFTPVLLDFGGVKYSQDAQQGQKGLTGIHGAIVGTYQYMAPEQARGEQATVGVDIFALGGMLCETVNKGKPLAHIRDAQTMFEEFGKPLPKCVHPELNDNQRMVITDLFNRMRSENPLERPVNADSVMRELAAVNRSSVMPVRDGKARA